MTDFVYNYIDSSHHEVKKVLYKLYNRKFIDDSFLEYDGDDDYEESIENNAQDVEWSNDGKWLAVGMTNSELVIFNEQGEPLFMRLFFELDVSITKVSFNNISNILAVSFSSGAISFVELMNGEEWMDVGEIYNSTGVEAIAWSPTNSQLLAYGAYDGLVRLHHYGENVDDVEWKQEHEDWIRDLTWSPDGTRVVSASDDGSAIIWSVDKGEVLHKMEGHDDYVRTVDWHPNGHEIITGSDDQLMITWDTLGQRIGSVVSDSWIYKARYSDSGDRIGFVSNLGVFCMLDTEKNQTCESLPLNILSFDWKGEQNTANIPQEENNIYLQFGTRENRGQPFIIPVRNETLEGTSLPSAETTDGNIVKVAWSPDGNFLAYAKENNFIVISEDSIKEVNLGYENVIDISWHPGLSALLPNSNLIATIDDYNHVRIWDAVSLILLSELTSLNSLMAIDWSPDGTMLACGTIDGNIELISWKDQKLETLSTTDLHNDYLRSLAWSPDGKYIATASDDLTSVIYDPIKNAIVQRLEGHSDWVRSVCWLSDTRLATGADDQKTIIWDKEDDLFSLTKKLTGSDPNSNSVPLGYHLDVAYTGTATQGMLATLTGESKLIFG